MVVLNHIYLFLSMAVVHCADPYLRTERGPVRPSVRTNKPHTLLSPYNNGTVYGELGWEGRGVDHGGEILVGIVKVC